MEHSIPISDAAVSTNDMGIVWDFTKHVPFPYQMLVCLDDMGIIWNCAKYIAFPYRRVRDHMVLVWDDPYHSHTRYYGKSMELCQIRSNPIVKDNRIKTEEDRGIHGFDMAAIAHTKAIYYPYMGHSLCHTISILGPHMAHIARFGKGFCFAKEIIVIYGSHKVYFIQFSTISYFRSQYYSKHKHTTTCKVSW